MNLIYNSNVLCAAEKSAGKPVVAILDELGSDQGVSLTTLRALVAAGRQGALYPSMFAVYLDEYQAGRLIDEHGAAECASAVGKALKGYFSRGAE